MKCMKSTRRHLVELRGYGWESLLDEVFAFCDEHHLEKLEMEEAYVNPKFLSPRDSFNDFNLDSLMSLAKLYPKDFDSGELRDLSHHLCLYIADVQAAERFSNIETIVELSRMLIQTRKHLCYPLVYRLLKLVLVLPVATATVRDAFRQ